MKTLHSTGSGQASIGLPGLLTVLAIAALIGLLSWASNREIAQQHELTTARLELAASRMEIERLSTTCAPVQAGEKLVATHHSEAGLKCLYSRQTSYGQGASTVIRRRANG